MQCKFGIILLLGILFTSQIFCEEEDLGPEERKFHKKKKPHLQSPCHRSNDPNGRFFDNSYQVNYYGNPNPCGGPLLGHNKPHKPFGGHGHGHHGGHGGHGGGLFGGHGGGFGGHGGGFGGHGGGFGGYGGGFGGYKPGGGYFDALGGNFKPNKIIKDVNKYIFRPLSHLL